MAYYRAVTDFFAWLDAAGIVALVDIEPLHVATYIETKPTVKQHLAAIRMLFDWLATGGILASNPATSVRGPKHVACATAP
jgi:site-specific recombinase XerD